jgi:hypothetical protein
MIGLALSLTVLISAQTASTSQSAKASNSLEPITVYDGSWLVTPAPEPGAAPKSDQPKPDQLTNHCHMTDAFYTCEQVVNGKPVAMLIFVAGEKPGSYYNQAILPDGHASGRGDLTIDGGHWTYLGKDDAGKPNFRVENYVKDHDHIHYEQYKADEAGKWTKTGEGNEVRVP